MCAQERIVEVAGEHSGRRRTSSAWPGTKPTTIRDFEPTMKALLTCAKASAPSCLHVLRCVPLRLCRIFAAILGRLRFGKGRVRSAERQCATPSPATRDAAAAPPGLRCAKASRLLSSLISAQTQEVPAKRACLCWLGYLDSNQEQLNQNQPCCQLHHTPPGYCGLAPCSDSVAPLGGPRCEFTLPVGRARTRRAARARLEGPRPGKPPHSTAMTNTDWQNASPVQVISRCVGRPIRSPASVRVVSGWPLSCAASTRSRRVPFAIGG